MDVPTSTWYGNSAGSFICFLAGYAVPFDTSRLQTLYPDHGTHLQKFIDSTNLLVADRLLTYKDILTIFNEAANAQIP